MHFRPKGRRDGFSNMTFDPEYNPKIENRAVFKLIVYVLGSILTSVVMLVINTGMVFTLAQAILKVAPDFFLFSQLIQLLILLGPVLLLYLEWYVWDVMTARRIRIRNRSL